MRVTDPRFSPLGNQARPLKIFLLVVLTVQSGDGPRRLVGAGEAQEAEPPADPFAIERNGGRADPSTPTEDLPQGLVIDGRVKILHEDL